MQKFKDAYIQAILAESDENDAPLCEHHTSEDIAEECLAKIDKDCQQFLEKAGDLVGDRLEDAGNDFWLTRNRHGAGFWDGDWDDEGVLTEIANSFGECWTYIGDDGLIYLG